jgi:hypothetical protein
MMLPADLELTIAEGGPSEETTHPFFSRQTLAENKRRERCQVKHFV